MAYSTLTINLLATSPIGSAASNTTTLTLTTSSYAQAVAYVQNLRYWIKDNNNIFYPTSAILSISIT